MNLTFGEQVKIVLSRKGMTIKELAEIIEEKTGKKMSRQNLTQRLGRDNFQEQDMRMIAEILGCPFQLSILGEEKEEVSEAQVVEERKPEKKKRQIIKKPVFFAEKEIPERDITIGELVDIHKELDALHAAKEKEQEEAEAAVVDEVALETPAEEVAEEAQTEEVQTEELVEEVPVEEPEPEAAPTPAPAEEKKSRGWRSYFQRKPKKEVQPEKKAEPEQTYETIEEMRSAGHAEEDLEKGEVNPYTGHEYENNSVRSHPKRIGYVQVYDRDNHQWTDMTEWAFMGYQERKKALLGEDYEPPIYLE